MSAESISMEDMKKEIDILKIKIKKIKIKFDRSGFFPYRRRLSLHPEISGGKGKRTVDL